MGQVASPRNALRQILQHTLQSDEQLLWSDYPHVKKFSFPSKEGLFDLLVSGIVAVPLTALWYGLDALRGYQWSNVQTYLLMFLLVFGMMCLNTFLRNLINAFIKAPRYLRYTIYALTDHRILVIVRFPSTKPIILEYLPHEIDLLTSHVRSADSGILPFGTPRHAKVGRYGPEFTFPGSFFVGISRVREVTALLQQLKANDEPLAQDIARRFTRE